MTDERERCLISVVHYSDREETLSTINIFKDTDYDICLVDNSPSSELEEYSDDVTIYLARPDNPGYTGGNNLAFQIGDYQCYFVLNPDVTINSIADIDSLVMTIIDGEASIVFPTVVDRNGERLYDPPTLEHQILRKLNILPELQVDANNIRYVDHGPGCAMAISADVIDEIGGFNEKLYMYSDEVELCYRARQHGYTVGTRRETQIVHHKEERFSRVHEVYFERNKLHISRSVADNHPAYILYLSIYYLWVFSKVFYSPQLLIALIRGLIDGVRGKIGKGPYIN